MKLFTLALASGAAVLAYKRGYRDGEAARSEGLGGTSPLSTAVATGKGIAGKVKQVVGATTGDVDLVADGAADQQQAAAEAQATADVVRERETTA